MTATVVEPTPRAATRGAVAIDPPVQRFLLTGIAWDGYESLLRMLGDRPIRITYDRGNLELMSPSATHEEFGQLFGLAIQALAEELGFSCRGLKSTTWRRALVERGIEADECFYLANLGRVLGKRTIDLDIDPPPDLAIEIEVSTDVLDRLAIYGALGIPEVWRFNGQILRVLELQPDATYVERDHSPALPFLPLEEFASLIQQGAAADHASWGRRFRAWIRETILPHYRPAG
jgi:Uma2 family endonuclease